MIYQGLICLSLNKIICYVGNSSNEFTIHVHNVLVV